MDKHEAALFDRLLVIRQRLRAEGQKAYRDGVKIEDGPYANSTDYNTSMDHQIWERGWYEAEAEDIVPA